MSMINKNKTVEFVVADKNYGTCDFFVPAGGEVLKYSQRKIFAGFRGHVGALYQWWDKKSHQNEKLKFFV